MFKQLSNTTFDTTCLVARTLPAMHASTSRLYDAALTLQKTRGQSNVARLLNESPQTVKNWEKRGVSGKGALNAAKVLGCRAQWLLDGCGQMVEGLPGARPNEPLFATSLTTVLDRLTLLSNGQWQMVKARLDSLPGNAPEVGAVFADVLPLLEQALSAPGRSKHAA